MSSKVLDMVGIGKALLGEIFLIVFGLMYLGNPDLGWYPPTAFIGVGTVLLAAGISALIGLKRHPRLASRMPVWKVVRCQNGCPSYAYRVIVKRPKQDMSTLFRHGESLRQALQAREQFDADCQAAVAAVPCPFCGSYQPDMLPLARRQYVHWTQILGWVIVAIGLAAAMLSYERSWVLSAGLLLVGASLIVLGMTRRRSVDPNAGDPAQRKALARSLARWGDDLNASMGEQILEEFEQ